MYDNQSVTSTRGRESVLATNKVLRNTYMLLSLTLLFSGFTAYLGMRSGVFVPILPFFLITYGLLFATYKTANSSLGLVFVFAFTGFLGFTLGPIIATYLHTPQGAHIVMTALSGTGIIFLGLSGYALTTRRDFSFMGGMLTTGILVAFLASLGAFVFKLPALELASSAVFIPLMAGVILFKTSQIIHGGERNYILATVTLYVALYNLFISLLQILSFFSGRN